MLKILKNEKGNLGIAMLVVIISILSGFALAAIANNDAIVADLQLSSVQETHLLRSEIGRGYMAIGNNASSTGTLVLPIRKVEVNSIAGNTTYAMKTKIAQTYEQGSSVSLASRRTISSKIKAFKKPASSISYNTTDKKVPIEKYGEKIIQKDTFAGFMYLTDSDISVNGDEVYFYGEDEIWGRVHSNTNIWLKNVSGWPTFHDLVTTHGTVESTPSSYPEEEVFLGGLQEEVGEVYFNPTAQSIRNNATYPFDADSDIVMVDLQGAGYSYRTCNIVETGEVDTLIIYDSYPPYGPVGDSIGVNYVPIVDSIWSPAEGGTVVDGGSIFVESELWIKGVASGKQTWGCAEDIYIIDDIWYLNTTKGENPDGSEGGSENTTDFLGIVSEGQIIIQYGYMDPADSLRKKPNCNDVYIYGALCALGDGGDEGWEDGIFTFQYQYPHPSTPAVTVAGELYDKIDLHRFKFPTSAFDPWPDCSSTNPENCPDYPFYNPIWPELNPTGLRGYIYLFGAVSQRRRGFVRRSGQDPLDTGYWDLDNYVFGGVCPYGATGYDKRYHYDRRFMHSPPPDFPEVHVKGGTTPFQGLALRFKEPPEMY